MTGKFEDKIIVALDTPYIEMAIDRINATKDYVTTYKIGHILYSSKSFWPIVDYLQAHCKKIFLDLKLWDVPTTLLDTIISLSDNNPIEYITIKWDVLLQKDIEWAYCMFKPVSVVHLSSNDNNTEGFHEWSKFIAQKYNGFRWSIVSPYFLKCAHVGDDIQKIVPGIRLSNQGKGPHDFTITPAEAFAYGADKIVLGSAIFYDGVPQTNLELVLKSLGE